jgi:acyl-coenzyme A thioesterase PaaI-like protein
MSRFVESQPPADYQAWKHPSPVIDAIGSLCSHRTAPLLTGFWVSPEKLNGRGALHGGVIAVIADVSIGHALSRLSTSGHRYVTVNLTCDLLGRASLGDWIDVSVTPSKTRGRLAAGSAAFRNSGRVIATARALFVPA